MGTLTLAQLKSEIKSFHADRDDFDSRLTSIINLAQMRIGRLARWEELNKLDSDTITITGTLATDKVYALPTGLRTIYNVLVYETGGDRFIKLKGISTKKFNKLFQRPEERVTALPEFYHRWGNSIEFYRIPDAAYGIDIKYAAYPTALASDSSTSDLDQKDDAIIFLVVSWMYLSLKRRSEASTYWNVYKTMMKEALGEDRESPDIEFGPSVGRSAPGDYWANPFISSIT